MHRTPGRFDRQWTLHRRPRADSGVTAGAFCRYHRSMPAARRLPPPWTIEEHTESFIVRDASGQLTGCPLIGNCGHRVRFEGDGSVANDPIQTCARDFATRRHTRKSRATRPKNWSAF
jgi:hypothetical protein